MEDRIDQRCVVLQGFPQTPYPEQDIHRLLNNLAGIQIKKICQLYTLSTTNTPDWVVLCQNVEDADAIKSKVFPNYQGCQLTVSSCGAEDVPQEWRTSASKPQGTMHFLRSNSAFGSSPGGYQHGQDILEEPPMSGFESMNYPNTGGSEHLSDGFAPRQPLHPGYRPTHPPIARFPGHTPAPVPLFQSQPNIGSGFPQSTRYTQPLSSITVDHPVSSALMPRPQEMHDSPELLTQRTVHHLKYPDADELVYARRTIEVHGCDFASGSLDKFIYYFENERRGGGDIENFKNDEENNMLVITFKDPSVAQRLVEKGRVTIAKEEAEIRPHTPMPVYVDKVLLKYPGAHLDKDSIELSFYLEARANADVKGVNKGAKNDVLLVTFSDPIDISKLQSACNNKPFKTKEVTAFKVPATRVLRVEGVPLSVASETISDYFETRKCGNETSSEVVKVEGLDQRGCYLVHLADHKVVEQISERVHTLGEANIKVYLHHKCVGWQSPESTDTTPAQMSGAIPLEGVDQLVPRFLKKSPKVLKKIQEKLGGYGLSLKLNESNQLFVFRQVGSECGTTTADGMDYKSSARSVISEFVLHLLVPIPMEVKGNIDTMLMQINFDETEVRMYTDKEVVAIVGLPTKANEVKEEFEKQFAHGISSKGPPKTEIVKPLAPLKTKFLRDCGFKEMIKQFPGVNARFDANDVHLSGPETSVKEAAIKMYELVNGTQTSEIEHVSKQQLTELQKKAVEDGLRKELKETGIVASWHAKESSLEVISTTPEKVGQVGEMILNTVVERVVPLEGKMQLLMQSESWESLRKSLIDHLPDTFSIHNLQDKNYLLIVGLKDDVECVYAEVTMFLSSNTVDETRLSFTTGQHRFLQAHYKEEVATIAKDLKDYHVRIIYKENGTEFTINGSKEGIDKCRKELTFLADKVISHKELLQKAGMARMLKTGQGGHIISHVEKVERCIIEVANEEKGEEENKHERQSNAATQEPVSTIVAVSNIAGGRKIYVREGDITTMKVSAIVNAANERLDHCGGLAKVIVDKAGKDVQEECNGHVNSYGAVLDGDAVLSKPGRLKGSCDFLVHAVGPRWEGGKKREKEKLKEAVTRSLELTDGRQGSSIAIPALSAGIFGYPKDAATRVITTAVRDYFVKHKSSTIKDVYFCTVKGKTVDSFVKSLQDVLGASNVHIQPRLQGGAGAQMQQSSPRTQRRVSALSDLKCGYKVKLVEGSIAEQKVDVIVNTTNKELNLENAGPVSTAILEVAGPELLSACRRYPQGIDPGSIVVTPGFKLKCKNVYHVNLKTSTPQQRHVREHTPNTTMKKAVADIVKECLTTADRHNCSSIAMPALGTGIGGYSRDLVAEAMLSTIHDFWSQCPNTSLTDIRVILYPRDRENIQVFKDQAQQMKTGGQRTSDFGRRVILSRGSITRFKADVIVNPTDQKLNLSRGRLSKAISDAAGTPLEAECRRKYPNGTNSLAVTSAGLLQASEIYHVVIPPWNKVRDEEILHRAVTLCLEEADKSKHTSLLFPTLGIGLSGYDKDVSARIMFTAIDDFWRNHPDTTLIDIKIVIYDKDNDVAKVFEKQSRSFYTTSTSSRRGRQLKTDHKSTEEPFDVSGGITFGNIHFTLKHGDLLKENVDCIITHVDSEFNLKKGTINQVLLRKYPAVGTDDRAQKENDLRSKGLTVSQVAGATFNTVIHYDPFHFSHGVKAILKACIKQADKMHCSSVALPALGQGPSGGVPEHLLMDYLYDELQDLSNLKYVTEVRLVLYEPDMYNRFNDLLASLLNRRGIAKKPFFGDKNKGCRVGQGGASLKTQPGNRQTESRLHHVAEHLPADGVEVEFFSDIKTCIQSAKQKLENACSKEFDDQPVEHDTIRTLDEEKILRLQSMARQRGVSIDINTRLGRIRLQGLKEDVAAMSKSVYELCLEQKDEEHAGVVGACVQWYYMDILNNGGEELVAYDQNTNKLIEKTFRGIEETHELEDTEGVKYIIDFKDMVEYREDDKSTKVIVVRKDLIQGCRVGQGGASLKTQPGNRQTESRLHHVAEHLPADGVEVEFFSDIKTCIQSAKQKLENACSKEFDDQPVEHDTIRTLDEEKILRLQSMARQRGVSIDINTRLGRIRLQGLKEDVAAMSKSVYELCLEQKDEEHAGVVGACVQWYYMDILNNGGEELVAYDQNTNKLIEKTFRGIEETHELEDTEGVKYIIDFKDMVEYREDDKSTKVIVVRKDLIQGCRVGQGGASLKTQPGNRQTESRLHHVAEHLPADGVEVEFFSDIKTCIQSAKQKLENACSKEFDDQPVEHDTIRTLDEEKILRLQSMARQRGVSIDINTRLGRIRLQGLKEDVAAMSKSVYELCLEQKDEEHAGVVGACVQWYYMDILNNGGEELVAYDQNTNKLIEKTFRGIEETHELEDTEGVKYIIDFKDMVEYREDDKSTKVIVVRKDLIQAAEFHPPYHWEPMGSSENQKVCRVSPDNAEYQNVAGSFSGAHRTIIKIERVQNKSLYKQYMAKKEEFRGRHSTIKQERQLWHGTSTDAIPSINSYGFNRSYCGKNAVVYGNGVYFAVNVNYSTQDKYSRPDPAGNKYIYLVDVLTGEYTLGKSGMRVPPPVDPATPAVLYDSVVENIHTPGMFVIFNDTQAYPKYLITYK